MIVSFLNKTLILSYNKFLDFNYGLQFKMLYIFCILNFNHLQKIQFCIGLGLNILF